MLNENTVSTGHSSPTVLVPWLLSCAGDNWNKLKLKVAKKSLPGLELAAKNLLDSMNSFLFLVFSLLLVSLLHIYVALPILMQS